MKKIVSVKNLIILLKFLIILNEINLRKNQEEDLYVFLNISNIICNQSNYITSFTMKICGETEIKKSQYFAFSFSDTKNISHSVQCSILINNTKKVPNSNESINNKDVIDISDLETHLTYHSISNINYNNSNISVPDNYDSDLEKDIYNSSDKVTNNYYSDRDNNDSEIEVTDNFYSNIQGTHNIDSEGVITENYDSNEITHYIDSDTIEANNYSIGFKLTHNIDSNNKETDNLDSNAEVQDKFSKNTENSSLIDFIYSDIDIVPNYDKDSEYFDPDIEVTDNFDSYIEKADNYDSNVEVTYINASNIDNFYSGAQLADIKENDYFNSDIEVTDKDESNIEIIDNYNSDISFNNTDNVYSVYEITDTFNSNTKIIYNNQSNAKSDSDEQKIKDDLTDFISGDNSQLDNLNNTYLEILSIMDNKTNEDPQMNTSVYSSFINGNNSSSEFEIIDNITQTYEKAQLEVVIPSNQSETTNHIADKEKPIPTNEIKLTGNIIEKNSTNYTALIETTIPFIESETRIAEIKTTIPNSELKMAIPIINRENINPTTEIEITSPITELEITTPKKEIVPVTDTKIETNKKEKDIIIPITEIETGKDEIEIIFPKTEMETIINSSKNESSNPTTKILNNITNSTDLTISTIPNIETTIIDKIITQNIIYPINHDYDFCYKAICIFNGMIKEEFEVKLEDDFPIFIDQFPENIFIQPLLYDITTYKASKCYQVKNIFKQVLKFKAHDSEKKISFYFISIILGKVVKNEEIYVDVFLKKKTQNLRNLNNLEENIALCKSDYNAVPVEGKEISNSYYCEINNIEKPNDYFGLIFRSSSDVKNIPNDTNYTDPSITDTLIKEGKIQDFSLMVFNAISLDLNKCHNTSIFTLLGNINKQNDEILYFGILLFLDNIKNATANCSLPSGIIGDINITCNVLNYFYDSTIYIPNHIIDDIKSKEPILNITEFKFKGKTTCQLINYDTNSIDSDDVNVNPFIPETNKIPTEINSDIIFRQISHLKINSSGKIITFNMIGFSFNSLEKNSYISISINLIKLNDKNNSERKAICTLNNDVNGNINKLALMIFECEVNNVIDIKNVDDIRIVSSPKIKNIPVSYSILVYAKKTDEFINQGILLDYMEENNLTKAPPLLSNIIINATNCHEEGSFYIQAYIDSSIERNISFYFELKNPKIDARCKIPICEEYTIILIKCNTMDNFNKEIIQIESKIVYDIDYNELFYISSTESLSYINCENNMEIKKGEATKKLNAILSFRQASKFKKDNNKYHFFLATFIKENIEYNTKITLKVKLKNEVNNTIKNVINKRKLSPSEIQNAECSVRLKTDIDEIGVGAAGWDCETGESSISDAIGLDIIGSDDISGIPDDPALIDPAQTDELIAKGEIYDYSIEENLNELLPIFNTLALNYSLCRNNGSFYFEGNVTSSIPKDVVFNLTLSYPETVFACRLPRTLKGQITQIECFNRDYFENSSIIIEETVIRDGFNEFFILRNISSGDLFITCSSTERQVNEKHYKEGFNIVTKSIINESSSGGIGSAGLIVILVVGIFVFVGIVTLLIFIRKKNKKKLENSRKVVNSSVTSIGGSSSSSYY